MPMRNTLFGTHEGADGDVVLLGLPFDHGSTGSYPGCATAPGILRLLTRTEDLRTGAVWNMATRAPLFQNLAVSDLGDLLYRASERRQSYFDRIIQAIQVLGRERKRVLALGGDHLVTLPLVRGLCAIHPRLQVVQIDAHTDYHEPAEDAEPTHATFIGLLVREPAVQRIIQIGVRGLTCSLPSLPPGLCSVPVAELASALEPGVPVYLTIDTDGFDPAIAPAVGHPVIGGLAWADLPRVLAQIAAQGCPLVGADWTEYNPTLDGQNYLTGQAIAAGLLHVIHALGRQEAPSCG